MELNESIRAAKESFEQRFAEGAFYNKQTQDAGHLQQILDFLPLRSGMRILDLGTGSGYLAFAIAERCPEAELTGLDIVEQTLEANRQKAAQSGLKNLRFVSYNGMDFPFADAEFDLVVSRYALHHFPDIRHSIREVSRILKAGGSFFLSDPAPNPCDTEGFADAYMQMKPDGHIRFYSKSDWQEICGGAGLHLSDAFDTKIRFPRKKTDGYDALLKCYSPAVIESYDLQIAGEEILLTEQVNNLLYRKA